MSASSTVPGRDACVPPPGTGSASSTFTGTPSSSKKAPGPGIERPDQAVERVGGPGPVEPAVPLAELGRTGRSGLVLGPGRGPPRGERVQELGQHGGREPREFRFQARRGRPLRHGKAALGQNGAGIETLVHEHRRGAGPGVAGQDGVRHRGGAAPAGQQGGMEIDAAQARGGEHGSRQQRAIRGDHGELGPQLGEGGLLGGLPQVFGGPDREAQLGGTGLDRGRAPLPAAPGRPRRRAIDRHDPVPRPGERLQRRQRERRGAHEHQAKHIRGREHAPVSRRPGAAPSSAWRACAG